MRTLGVLVTLQASLLLFGCECGTATGGSTGGDSGGSSAAGGGSGGSASTGGGNGGAGTTGLAFDPPEQTVVLDGSGTAKMVSFQLKEKRSDGTTLNVDAQQLFFDRPDLGSAAPGGPVVVTIATQFAGTATLATTRGMHNASAKVHVKQEVLQVDGAIAPATVTALQAPNLSQDPDLSAVLYPYDKTVFPLGLVAPLVMWTAPAAGDTYLLRLERKNYRYEQVFAAPMPGRFRVPQARWDEVTTASDASDPLVMTLNRYAAGTSTAYQSVRHEWRLSSKSLRGAIYYWTTSGSGQLARIRPGVGSAPETIGGGQCMGCHAVSADGTRLVAAVEAAPSNDFAGMDRAWVTYDLPSGTEVVRSTSFAGNLALNPNGTYVVYGTSPLKLGNASTGARIMNSDIESLPLDMGMTNHAHPAFSPDGKKLATVQTPEGWHEWKESKLMISSFDEAAVKFSASVPLASSMLYPAMQHAIAYPSFTPDSQWVAFHVGDYASGCNAAGCDENTPGVASLWLQSISGTPPIRLAQLNDSSDLPADDNVSFEPTFNPLESGGYFWVVFTSTRDWGNQLVGTPRNGKKRLWVAAIDKTIGTTDPSHPAFYLEGQDATMNMRGFWTLAACTATGPSSTCTAGFECCSGFCNAGTCIDPGPIACKAENEACTTTAECCNSGAFACSDGRCKNSIN